MVDPECVVSCQNVCSVSIHEYPCASMCGDSAAGSCTFVHLNCPCRYSVSIPSLHMTKKISLFCLSCLRHGGGGGTAGEYFHVESRKSLVSVLRVQAIECNTTAVSLPENAVLFACLPSWRRTSFSSGAFSYTRYGGGSFFRKRRIFPGW